MSDDTSFKHGTNSGYKYHKCRCDECRRWRRDRARRVGENRSEKAKENKRRWQQDNPHYRRSYAEANREQILAQKLKWREGRREELARKQREYYVENIDAAREYSRRYAADNSAACVERARLWAIANPERALENARRGQQRRRARVNCAPTLSFTQEQLEQRFAYYGNRCYLQLPGICTGEPEHIEHVKPLSKGGAHMLSNIRPACQPCNYRKSDKWPFSA